MTDDRRKTNGVAKGAVIAGLVVGAGYGGWELQQWSAGWDRAAEKGVALGVASADVSPELLSWQEMGRVATGMASVKSFALLADGGVVVAGERKLRVLGADGKVVRDIGLEDVPQAVAVDGSRVYVGMKDHVEVWELSGKMVGRWDSLGAEAFITCVTVAPGGKSVWVANAGWRIVTEYDLTGRPIREVGREDVGTHAPGLVVPSAHLDVAVGADGLVWVNNPGRHELEAFDGKGMMVRQWGMAGMGIGLFSGCCNPTDFAFLAGGRVVTAEKGRPRVKVYGSDGKLESVVALEMEFAPEAAGMDVAGDGAGRVWVMDPVGHELRIYGPKMGLAMTGGVKP